jgi:hypothetical protein
VMTVTPPVLHDNLPRRAVRAGASLSMFVRPCVLNRQGS